MKKSAFLEALEREIEGVQSAMLKDFSRGYWGSVPPAFVPIKLTAWQRVRAMVWSVRAGIARPLQWLADAVRGYELRSDYYD
jgi:hypothetical protein